MIDADNISDIDTLRAHVKRLDRENRLLRQTEWDDIYKAAIPLCLKEANKSWRKAMDGDPNTPRDTFLFAGMHDAELVADIAMVVRNNKHYKNSVKS